MSRRRAEASNPSGVPRGVAKYLQLYSCPEVDAVAATEGRYEAVVVIPVYRESSQFLQGLTRAVAGAKGRVLCIVVVNAPAEHWEETWREHRNLLADLTENTLRVLATQPEIRLCSPSPVRYPQLRADKIDLLVVDRASAFSHLPARQGVGLARKIGSDLAVRLWANGRIAQPWIYCTDADASLGADYFEPMGAAGAEVAVRLKPFAHQPGEEGDEVDEATQLYEVQLRYYVLSLRAAGSPYAYHCVGSTLVVGVEAYCAVRGFPKRLSGEDFHLLNKLSKVGKVSQAVGSGAGAVHLRARTSSRTVHGTGVAVARLVDRSEATEHRFYHPRIFELLAVWLRGLEEFCRHREVSTLREEIAQVDGGQAVCSVLAAQGAFEAVAQAAKRTSGPAALRRRVHEWFDALRTLRFVHLLQQEQWSPVSWRQALERSVWNVDIPVDQTPAVIAHHLRQMELGQGGP